MRKVVVDYDDWRRNIVVVVDDGDAISVTRAPTKTVLQYDDKKTCQKRQMTIELFGRALGSDGARYKFKRRFLTGAKYELRGPLCRYRVVRKRGERLCSTVKKFSIVTEHGMVGELHITATLTEGEYVTALIHEEEHFEPCLILAYCVFSLLLRIALAEGDPS
jgi:hypothetical protein